ncbi:hypothetical protein D3C85_1611760 [compost metagenome]
MSRATKLPLRPQAMVAIPQTKAMAVTLRTRPQRSASTETGKLITPTISATIPTNEPSWASLNAHSAFSEGKTALIT